jgi:hypothetical protein
MGKSQRYRVFAHCARINCHAATLNAEMADALLFQIDVRRL